MKSILLALFACALFACNNEGSNTPTTDTTIIEQDNTVNRDTSVVRDSGVYNTDTTKRDSLRK